MILFAEDSLTQIMIDNQFHKIGKHIDVKYHFVGDLIGRTEVVLKHVASTTRYSSETFSKRKISLSLHFQNFGF